MKKSNKRAPLVFYFGVFVLCMTLFSSHMTGGLYARYTSSASGSDSARVARFDVSIGLPSETKFDLNCYDAAKQSISYQIEVAPTAKNEVAVQYSLVVTFAEAPPSWLVLSIPGKSAPSVTDGRTVYTFANIGTFSPPSSAPQTFTLTVKVPVGTPSTEVGNYNLTAKVSVEVTQID